MKRHLVHSVGAMLALVVCLSIFPGRAEAQTGLGNGIPGAGVFNDPFTFYYAIYLPNQQLQALRPTPLDSVNEAMVARQYYAQQNRRGLYDPISPYSDTYDPLRPYSDQGGERRARPSRFSRDPSNMDGMGPSLYFNRISQYYPELSGRVPRNRNAYVTARGGRAGRTARGGGGGGGGGMGGMGGGMGGMGGGMGGMGGGMGGMGMPGMGMF